MRIRFWPDCRGATAIEYALIATLISLSIVAAAGAIGKTLANNYYAPVAKALN